MINFLKSKVVLVLSVLLLTACGESDAPQEKITAVTEATKATATQLSADVTEAAAVVEEQAQEMVAEATTEMDMAEPAEATAEATSEVSSSEPEAVASDKPYQVVDGKISANAIEGWKTYNGGGCGACHGKGGIGAVGPNLGNSVTQKLSKEEFVNIVTNGKSGTMMRPHKTNTRVMENMDNLYAYLVARGDDVLGPGNLIKLPLGK